MFPRERLLSSPSLLPSLSPSRSPASLARPLERARRRVRARARCRVSARVARACALLSSPRLGESESEGASRPPARRVHAREGACADREPA